jgi:hypothetical protein
MLLKLKVKVVNILMDKLSYITLAIMLPFVANVNAVDQDIQFHGFVAQGVIDVNGSDFVNDDGSLSPKLTEVGINASYQLSSNFRLAGQVVYLNGGNRYAEGIRVDYALLDWSVYESQNWQANVYLGRFKNNHWLYASSRDIPFARPSIILPQSVYFDGFRDIAVGADGAAMKISHSNDSYGNFDFNFSYGTSPISDKQAEIILSEFAQGTIKQDSDIQASIYWQPSFSLWRFGASYLDSDFSYQGNDLGDIFFDGSLTFHFYTVNALFEGERWEFSGEIYQEKFTTKGFYHPLYSEEPVGQGVYLQSRYKISEELTILARYENFYNDRNDKNGHQLEEDSGGKIPAYFAYHRDTTLGLSYDFSSNIRLRFEYHWFQGAARLTPVVLPNPEINNSKNWQLWAMQLMYWF